MSVSLTPEQERAIGARGNVIVSASAGSGKTFVMIERLVALVLGGTDVKSILAVTFKRYGFNACFIAVKKIQLLNCEARPLAIAYVHAVEHAYPVLSLRSSCACMQRKHCV